MRDGARTASSCMQDPTSCSYDEGKLARDELHMCLERHAGAFLLPPRQLQIGLVPRIRFHDLRHYNATVLLGEGVHPKIVQERLGHATISMTLDIYSHVLPGLQRQAAQALERRLLGRDDE